MRSAKPHRHAEALGGANHHIRPHRTRRLQQHQAQQVGADDGKRTGLVRRRDLGMKITDLPGRPRILQDDCKGLRCADSRRVARAEAVQRPPQRPCTGRQHCNRLRMQIGADRDRRRLSAGGRVRHSHRLRSRRRLVQQRGIGDGHPGQVADHGLEVEQRLKPALREFGLIRRVGSIPTRVLQHIALDHRRGMRSVVALPDQWTQKLVLSGKTAKFLDHGVLADRVRQPLHRRDADVRRHRLRGERLQALRADNPQHGRDIRLGGCNVPLDERLVHGCEFGHDVHHALSATSAS